jgi:hypothetical protein
VVIRGPTPVEYVHGLPKYTLCGFIYFSSLSWSICRRDMARRQVPVTGGDDVQIRMSSLEQPTVGGPAGWRLCHRPPGIYEMRNYSQKTARQATNVKIWAQMEGTSESVDFTSLHSTDWFVRVRVTLRLAVYRQSVRIGDKTLETHDQ